MPMNDPHVARLRYQVVTDKSISYDNPATVTSQLPAYRLTLDSGVLTIEMNEHHATINSATALVHEYLLSWELQTALDMGPGRLKFEFMNADVIDRKPPPSGSSVVHEMSGTSHLSFSASGTLHLICNIYPPLLSGFLATPLVEKLWSRYLQYLDGKDILTTVGFFIYSTLKVDAGDRPRMAAQYAIDKDVLDKMANLTSELGDTMTARKVDKHSQDRPLSLLERHWVETCCKMLIRRVGEVAYDPSTTCAQITLANMPKL